MLLTLSPSRWQSEPRRWPSVTNKTKKSWTKSESQITQISYQIANKTCAIIILTDLGINLVESDFSKNNSKI